MQAHPHYVKAAILGHPIHALLVAFPIAFYTSGMVGLIAFAAVRDPFWFRAAMTLLFAGGATALLAAVFGMIDLFLGVPTGSAARKTGVKHFGLQLLAAVLFLGTAFLMYGDWIGVRLAPPRLRVAAPIAIGAVAFVTMAIASWLGWKLVEIEHVGVDLERPVQP